MMIHAYNEIYLQDAKRNLGAMFDYAVTDCKFDIDWFSELFLKSGFARLFGSGSPYVVAGMSGVELAQAVIDKTYWGQKEMPAPTIRMDKTPAYWAGWAVAAYQWHSAYRFQDIFAKVKMSEVVAMYTPFHEMDLQQFYSAMDRKMLQIQVMTNLKAVRQASGLSQKDLAVASGVSLRSIQMYEQRKNDIDKAQGQTLYKLAATLGCTIEDLLESPAK